MPWLGLLGLPCLGLARPSQGKPSKPSKPSNNQVPCFLHFCQKTCLAITWTIWLQIMHLFVCSSQNFAAHLFDRVRTPSQAIENPKIKNMFEILPQTCLAITWTIWLQIMRLFFVAHIISLRIFLVLTKSGPSGPAGCPPGRPSAGPVF